MGYTPISDQVDESTNVAVPSAGQRWWLHIVLFVATFFSCTLAGIMWQGEGADLSNGATLMHGLTYAVLIMTFISAHEFGHFFAARYHKVDATLPYYIPMPFPTIMPFGTMGALIRTRSAIRSRKVLFDVGVAGPLAGFVVCVVILIIGFVTLPDKNYLYRIHPEYLTLFGGEIPEYGLRFGDTLLFSGLAQLFANPNGFLPPMNEVYHYPFLCVGWFGLFVTSLNLLPIGQLDGGHISYAMFGSGQSKIARLVMFALLAIGFFSLIGEFRPIILEDSPDEIVIFLQSILQPPINWLSSSCNWIFDGWVGWLFWAMLARFIFRLDHPPLVDEEPLDPMRMRIGWLAILVFILTLSLNGISERIPVNAPDSAPEMKTVVQLHQMENVLPLFGEGGCNGVY